MKANKRIRDLRRRSKLGRRLFIIADGVKLGSTTLPVDSGPKTNDAQEEPARKYA